MNLIISSWPASGGSTIALMMAMILNYEYVYAGSVLRYLSENLGSGQHGDDLNSFEDYLGNKWDELWETYREYVLCKEDKLIFEGKTAGFLQKDKSNIYSIMITARLQARHNRTKSDKRHETIDELMARDKELTERWGASYGINIYDEVQIQNNYDLHLDTTEMTIIEELENILMNLANDTNIIDEKRLLDSIKEAKTVVETYMKDGKSSITNYLLSNKLLRTPQRILSQWGSMEEIKPLLLNAPKELREFIQEHE